MINYADILTRIVDEMIRPTKKVYISGPITNDPDHYKENFRQAKEFLIHIGYDVVSPAEYPENLHYNDYIKIGLKDLMECDAICMLPNWTESKGACLEHHYAEVTNIPIFYFPVN